MVILNSLYNLKKGIFMPRRRRALLDRSCYHITHRCHDRKFLFKFKYERQNYIKRLRFAADKYKICILNYMITSNHTHLLIWTKDSKQIPLFMQYLEGEQGQKYNMKHKGRNGAFWSDRYHSTLIEDGSHLANCLFYIDMNMVRAGVVRHPKDWLECGHIELSNIRKRYCIINKTRLCACLMIDEELFLDWYNATLEFKS